MLKKLLALLALVASFTASATEQTIPYTTLPSGSVILGVPGISAITGNFNDLYSLVGGGTAPAFTLKGNCTSTNPGPVTNCTEAQVASMVGGGGGGGGSSDPQLLEACTYSSGGNAVDSTGNTDSRAAIVSALAVVAGTSQILYVNCPIWLHMGYDNTKSIFLSSNTSVKFGPQGKFILDNVMIPGFLAVDQTDITFQDWKFEYIGQPGTTAIGCASTSCTGVVGSAPNNSNGGTQRAWMTSNLGVTLASGVYPQWSGLTNIQALVMIKGSSSRINFVGDGRAYVPDGASVANYIPVVFSLNSDWIPGANVTSSTPCGNGVGGLCAIPDQVRIEGRFDGYLMGVVGASTNSDFFHVTGLRYTDYQDGTPGTVTLSSTLASGATTGTLSSSVYPSGWPLQTGSYYLTFTQGSGSQGVYVTLTQGSLSTGTFSSALTAASTSAVAASGNVGGVATWFAPPHLFYTDNINNSGSTSLQWNNSYRQIMDLGIRMGLGTSRTTGSGTALSLKVEPDNGTVIDGYLSLRPDGFADILSTGYQTSGGVIRNVYAAFNSATPTVNNKPVWGLRFPSSSPYIGLVMENITLVDENPAPAQFPVIALTTGISQDVSITGLKVYLNDWPTSAAGVPGFPMEGNQITLQAEYHFAHFNSATRSFSPVDNGSYLLTNSNIDLKLYGWRDYSVTFASTPITFTAAIANGQTSALLTPAWAGTTGTYAVTFSDGEVRNVVLTNGNTTTGTWSALSQLATASATAGLASGATTAPLQSAWLQDTGTYKVTFSDGEMRYLLLTNNSTTVPAWTALGNAATQSASATGALNANYSGNEARPILDQNGAGVGNHVHIQDMTNEWEATLDGALTKEQWTQEWSGTPSGTSQNTHIQYPAQFAIDQAVYSVSSAIGSGYTWSIGYSGNTSAFFSGLTDTVQNNGMPPITPIVSPNSPLLLTPTTTFPGTGNVIVTAHGTTIVASH